MKQMSNIITVFPDAGKISTDKEFLSYLKSRGIKRVDVNDNGIHHYGWVNKKTKTSIYMGSDFKNHNLLFTDNSLIDLWNWMNDQYKESGLDCQMWKEMCK